MKIAQKLTLCLVAVTGALFLVGGYWMVSQNFEASLEQAAAQNAAQHTAQRLSVEDAALRLAMQQASGESVLHAAGTEVAAAMPQAQFALMNEGWANLYSRVPQQVDKNMLIDAARAAQGGYVLRKAQENTYMFVAGTLTAGSTQGTLVSVFDITELYAQRTAQLHRFWRLCAVLLCAAAVLTLCFTTIVLRPLKRLSAAAASIAAGQYGQRTQVHTQDEVGRLSQDFDAMAASVEQAMESLEDEVRRRDDFVAAFTHEIKTPMTAMLGYADLLRSRDIGQSAREKAADYVYHETKRLEALSLKLLELMRLGHEGAGLESVPLSAVFSDVRHACAGLEGANVTFADARGVWVLADKPLLADLLYNLVVNAVHASKPGAPVQVGFEVQNDTVALFVRDEGRGIPQNELGRITEPFYMVDKSGARAQNGSGLGLALCQRIAAAHQTALEFESEVGRGTIVRLPLQRGAAP
mgnify:FL=1